MLIGLSAWLCPPVECEDDKDTGKGKQRQRGQDGPGVLPGSTPSTGVTEDISFSSLSELVIRKGVICGTALLWLFVLSCRPHKEERFMYPIYGIACLSAALSVVSAEELLKVKYSPQFHYTPPYKMMAWELNFLPSTLLGWCRRIRIEERAENIAQCRRGKSEKRIGISTPPTELKSVDS
jgi:hypothetical protein